MTTITDYLGGRIIEQPIFANLCKISAWDHCRGLVVYSNLIKPFLDGFPLQTSKPKQVLFFFRKSFAGIPRKNFVNLGPIYADPAMSSGVCLFAGEGIIIHKINRGLAVSLFLLLADVLHKVDLGPGALVASGQHDLPDLVALLGSPRREQAQRVV